MNVRVIISSQTDQQILYNMNKKIFIPLLIGAMLVFVTTSCRTVNKHRSKSETSFDSSGSLKKDTSSFASIDTVSEKNSTEINEDGAEIYFNDEDTSVEVLPVKIEQKNGITTIDPGKRKVKSIKTTSKQVKILSDSSGKKAVTTSTGTTEQKSSVKKTTKTVEVVKKTSSFNWWWLLLIIPAFALYYYFGGRFDFVKDAFNKIKSLIRYSNDT